MTKDWFAIQAAECKIWKPYAFDRVTVSISGQPFLSFLGTVHSEFASGPNIRIMAEAAAQISGSQGFYGLLSCRKLGHWWDRKAA